MHWKKRVHGQRKRVSSQRIWVFMVVVPGMLLVAMIFMRLSPFIFENHRYRLANEDVAINEDADIVREEAELGGVVQDQGSVGVAPSHLVDMHDESIEIPYAHANAMEPEMVCSDGVQHHGALRVVGTQLTDVHGKPVQLRGFSSHGLQWYPTYMNSRALLTTRDYGANMVRAAMYADSIHGGYNQDTVFMNWNRNMMYMTIENALSSDMYVIADWHLLMDKTPLTYMQEASLFFDNLSKHYADEPGVLYEICNEPNGDVPWKDIKTYAEQVIPMIRNNNPDAIIIVGTPQYSMDLFSVIDDPLEFENILYSYHFYTGYNTAFQEILDLALEAGLPVFVTEWGIKRDRDSGELGLDEASAFHNFLEKRNISWANWSLSNKEEDHAAIRSDVQKLSGWVEDDLTESGKFVFDALSR